MGIETLAIGSLVASTAGGVIGAMGADKAAEGKQYAANAEAAMSTYKAGVARNNAIIAERNAVAATEAGTAKAATNDMKTKAFVGGQVVAQAANGLDVGSGTNVAIRDSAKDLGRLDTLTILANATKNAAGFRAQGMNFTAEGLLDDSSAEKSKVAGQYAREAGDYNVATSLLGGASSVSSKWLGYQQSGVFS